MTLSVAINDFISPIKEGAYTLTTKFGVPAALGGGIHDGQDFAAPEGTPIYAPADGTVKAAFWNEGGGNTLEIIHPGGILTGYAHAQRYIVKAGQEVRQGQIIGYVGKTGKLVTGSHLHFWAEHNGTKVDPMDIFDGFLDVPEQIYQDIVADVLDSLKKSTKENVGKQTWGDYATGFNTDFGPTGGLNFAREQLQAAVAALGWEDRTIEAGDLEKMAAAISEVEPPKMPWDIAAEAAATIGEVVGAVAGFLFDPMNWARLFALIAGAILAFVGFNSMWRASSGVSA